MDEFTKVLLGIAGGAFGGAIVAGVFGLTGAWIASRREHFKWLREEKLKAYSDFLKAIEAFNWSMGEMRLKVETPFEMEAYVESVRKIEQSRLLILAPSKVYHCADNTLNAVARMGSVLVTDLDVRDWEGFQKSSNAVRDAQAAFVAAARDDLNIPLLAEVTGVPFSLDGLSP